MCSWSCVSCTMFERDWVFWPFISIQPWHCTDSVHSHSPLPSLVIPKTCSVWQVPIFFPSGWGLLAWMPGFASHGSGLLLLNPFAPGVVFWSLSCYKELKLTTNWFTGRTLRGLLIQMQNISLRSSGMRRKFLGLRVTQQSWLLLFAFSPSFFFRFSCLIFFLLLGI